MWVSRIINRLALIADSIFGESQKWIEQRLEMRFADQRCRVTGTAQVAGNARCIFWQRNAVHPYAMRADMLTSDHRAARWHAHDILWVRAIKSDTCFAERINIWRACDRAAVAAERIVTLLVGGDK